MHPPLFDSFSTRPNGPAKAVVSAVLRLAVFWAIAVVTLDFEIHSQPAHDQMDAPNHVVRGQRN
jgi:hypothetical protein